MKTTTPFPIFYVTTTDSTGKELLEVKFDKFDAKAIMLEIRKQLESLAEGSEVEYWKSDKKYAYFHYETYLKRGDKIMREIVKGDRVYTIESKLFSALCGNLTVTANV